MPAEWFIMRDGKTKQGPFDSRRLKELAAAGLLLPEHKVWKADLPDWVPATYFRDVFPMRTPPAVEQATPGKQSSDAFYSLAPIAETGSHAPKRPTLAVANTSLARPSPRPRVVQAQPDPLEKKHGLPIDALNNQRTTHLPSPSRRLPFVTGLVMILVLCAGAAGLWVGWKERANGRRNPQAAARTGIAAEERLRDLEEQSRWHRQELARLKTDQQAAPRIKAPTRNPMAGQPTPPVQLSPEEQRNREIQVRLEKSEKALQRIKERLLQASDTQLESINQALYLMRWMHARIEMEQMTDEDMLAMADTRLKDVWREVQNLITIAGDWIPTYDNYVSTMTMREAYDLALKKLNARPQPPSEGQKERSQQVSAEETARQVRAKASQAAKARLIEYELTASAENRPNIARAVIVLRKISILHNKGQAVDLNDLNMSVPRAVLRECANVVRIAGDIIPKDSKYTLSESWTYALGGK